MLRRRVLVTIAMALVALLALGAAGSAVFAQEGEPEPSAPDQSTTSAPVPSAVTAAATEGGFQGLIDSLSEQGIPVVAADAHPADPGEVSVTVQGSTDLYSVVELASQVRRQ